MGEKLIDAQRVQLLIECLPNLELVDTLFSVMPQKSADELGQSLLCCLSRMGEDMWKYIVALIERLDRENARSALLLWFIQSKAKSPDVAFVLARHANTRPVLVKRLVDMVRFEEQEVRARAGDLIYRLYAANLISEEGVHLVRPVRSGEEREEEPTADFFAEDYTYIGPKD